MVNKMKVQHSLILGVSSNILSECQVNGLNMEENIAEAKRNYGVHNGCNRG